MNKEQFDSLYYGKAVHCDTEEKANHFLALADRVGYKWGSGDSLIEKNEWKRCKKATCYHVTKDGILFEKTEYYHMYDYEITEYELQPIKKGK